ncbi:MAG: hypothetical protein C4520_09995 [Candidatus Abyssobacteria bacterium SURF_5]|uniref:YfhO family protein n=1 Tax=Abyssobacteria bacterium (strain SURF_5) TaxID=2093360 RepID=A0A3A4NTG2_ABYX5|nr:MAG: hypothetical protein C4520_09995 [Candidatus Abyssubacteria bacterium SURF_5]
MKEPDQLPSVSALPEGTPPLREGIPHEEDSRANTRRLGRIDWCIILVFVAVLLFYFRSLLWTDSLIYGELDIRRSVYLFRKVSYDLLHRGHLPLWMPYIYCGMPLLGSFLATPFYPPDLLFAAANLPLPTAFNWDLLIHLILAQVFSFLFFRRLVGSRLGATFGSLWFWNIFFLNSVLIGDALNIRAMLLTPVVFYFVEAAFASGLRPAYLLFLPIVFSLQSLSGGVQFAFYTMAAAAAYAGFLLLYPQSIKQRLLLSLGFASAVAIGLALAGIQLAPQWEYSRLSLRSSDFDWFRVWGAQPEQLLNYLIPSGEGLCYFGIIPIILASFSTVFWKDSRKYFFVALGVLSITYSLGGNTRISILLADLPLVREFRGPFRAAILFNLSVFALAGGAFAVSIKSAGKKAILLFGVVTIVLVVGLAAAARASDLRWADVDYKIWFSLASAAASIFLAYFLFFSRRLSRYSAWFLIVLLALDLGLHYGGSFSAARVDDLFVKDEAARLLEEKARDARIMVYNTAHTNYFALFGLESAGGHHPFPLLQHVEFLPLLEKPEIASLCGVKYSVIYQRDQHGRPFNPPLSDRTGVSINLMPLKPLARAFLVRRFRTIPPDAVLSALQDDFEPASEVILEEDPGLAALAGEIGVDEGARILESTESRVLIETEAQADALLVVTNSYYPGWQAMIDGRKARILRANYIFQAVAVPGGRHTVEINFEPKSLVAGAVVSCVGGACWLGLALMLLRSGPGLTQKPDPIPQGRKEGY